MIVLSNLSEGLLLLVAPIGYTEIALSTEEKQDLMQEKKYLELGEAIINENDLKELQKDYMSLSLKINKETSLKEVKEWSGFFNKSDFGELCHARTPVVSGSIRIPQGRNYKKRNEINELGVFEQDYEEPL